jgi:hypothetical protein
LTKHGEEGEIPPDELGSAFVMLGKQKRGTIIHETGHQSENVKVRETMSDFIHEIVCILGNKSLANDEVVGTLDQMIHEGRVEFLVERNRKELEEMRNDARTPLYPGSTISKLKADILLVEMKVRNGMSDTRFNDVLSLL